MLTTSSFLRFTINLPEILYVGPSFIKFLEKNIFFENFKFRDDDSGVSKTPQKCDFLRFLAESYIQRHQSYPKTIVGLQQAYIEVYIMAKKSE